MARKRTDSQHLGHDGLDQRTAPGRGVPPQSERDWLTTEEVAAENEVHYRTVARWASDRLIEVDGGGHGEPWRWNAKNQREAFVLARLRHEGFSLQELRTSMETLRSIGHNPFSKGKFLVLQRPTKGARNRGSFVKITDTGEAMELCKGGGVQLLLPFAPWSSGAKA